MKALPLTVFLPGVFLLLTFSIPSANAQATLGSATVTGTVRDSTGLAIPGATVVLADTARGESRQATTNNAGAYVFPNIPTGTYRLDARKNGFQSKRLTGIELQVGQVATLDVTLDVGTVSTVISVSGGQSTIIDPESDTIGTVVNSKQVQQLPLNGRNFLQLAVTTSGASPTTGQSDVASSQTGHPDRSVVIDGIPPTTTGYTIDGIATRGQRIGESALNLSIAAIDQFKVQQSFFLPGQGPDPALVNVTTKGGTNAFHGQLFEFLRNRDLDARHFFAPAPEDLKRNQFGGALGGPILRNRLFFYGFYEGTRQVSAFSSHAYTPTTAMFGGDFSSLATPIYDPATYSPATGKRSPFPGNSIPATRINSVSKNLLDYYLPGASLSERPNNLFGNPVHRLNDDQGGLRIDTQISNTQTLFGQFIHENSPVDNPGLFPLSGTTFPNSTTLAVLQHTWTIGPTLVNTIRAGFTRSEALEANEGFAAGRHILGSIGITNALSNEGVTAIGLTGYTGFGRSLGTNGNIDNSYQLDEEMNLVRGKNTFQFGASIRYHRTWEQNADASALGNLDFQPVFTAQLSRGRSGDLSPVKRTGDSFADFLLGMPFHATLAGLPMFQYRYTEYMPYFQDTWRITGHLTINAGISWYLSTVPNPQGQARKYVHGFDPATGLLTYAALGQVSPQVLSFDRNNLTPRLGFAWQPRFLPNTVVRAGAGTYYFNSAIIEAQFAMVGPPFNTPLQLFNPEPNPTYVLGQNVFPPSSFPALSPGFAASLPKGTTSFLLRPPGPVPYVNQWDASIEHAFGANDSIELDYVGSSSHHIQNRYNSDQCVPTAALFCSATAQPYPRYAGLLTADFNGNSSYEAFYAKYRHRVSQGLNVRIAYTFSKTLSDAYEGPHVATSSQIASCRRCDKGLTSFDQASRFVASAIYDIPIGRRRSYGSHLPRALNVIAGDWTITAIATMATGFPIFISSPNQTTSIYPDQRPNRVCDGADSSLSGHLRTNGFVDFDTSCFVTPDFGYFGNSGRTPLFGPGLNNWDLGILKLFPIPVGEQTRLEFRGELFNAFNHAQFDNPNANTGSSNFGVVGSARDPRLVQLALKLMW